MAELRVFHVYALLSPDDDLVHYVGKTCKLAERFKQHVDNARRHARDLIGPPCNRREGWLYGLAVEGRQPVLAVLEEIPVADCSRAAFDAADREALALEAAWIARLRSAGHPLTNADRDKRAEDVALVLAATERGRHLALSLGRTS